MSTLFGCSVFTENMPYFTMLYRPIVIESNLALKGKILFIGILNLYENGLIAVMLLNNSCKEHQEGKGWNNVRSHLGFRADVSQMTGVLQSRLIHIIKIIFKIIERSRII